MDSKPETIQLAPGPALEIRAQVPQRDLPEFFGAAFHELAALAGDQLGGSPFAIYHAFDSTIDVSAVVPLRGRVEPRGRVSAIDLPGGPAVQIKHVGPYEDLGETYRSLQDWLESNHRTREGDVREIYVSMPTVPPADQVTYVIQPLHAP